MSKHPLVHIEFSAIDRKVLGQFYTDLFGWEITHMDDMNYTMFQPAEGVGGGLNPVAENYPVGTIAPYFDTDDIDTTLARVKALGGEIVREKSEIPGMGWYGFFKDPSGNLVGLFTSLVSPS